MERDSIRISVKTRWRPIIAVMVWLAVVLTGCAHGMPEGIEALSAEDYERAESIAQDELEAHPDSPWGHQLMAESLAAQGAHRQALDHAEQAAQSDAFPVRNPRVLGDIHRALQNPVDAAEAYHRARQADLSSVDDDDFEAVLEDAVLHAATRGDHRARWRVINWLADVAPDHPDATPADIASARRTLAVELRRNGDYLDAVDLLEDALDDDPRHLRSEALELGAIYARLDMPDDALRAWQHYLDADVDDDELIQRHLDVADSAGRHNLNDVAADTLQQLPADIGTPARRDEVLLELIRYQLRADRSPEARRSIDAYLQQATDGADEGRASPIPYQRVVDIADELNRTRLQITLLERAVEQAQPNRDITARLATIYARRAQLDSVEETLELFVERSEPSTEARRFAGNWARERNNFQLARDFLERAVDDDRADADTWRELAEVQGELEDFDAMARSLDTYVERRDATDDALSTAASTLIEYRLFEEAERLLRQLQQRSPRRRSAARQLAELYDQWSRPDDAAAVWQEWINARGNQPEDMSSVAHLHVRSGDLQRGAELFERAAERGEYERWINAAELHHRRQDPTAVVRTVERFIDDHPHRAGALIEAASLWERADMDARQIEALTELIDIAPEEWSDQRLWSQYTDLARLLIDDGQHAAAVDYLSEFVDSADAPVDALGHIASRIRDARRNPILLDFFLSYEHDESARPEILRIIGDTYRRLADDDSTTATGDNPSLRRAQSYYLQYLDESDIDDRNWRVLATEWSRHELWRPAARAYERDAEQRGSSGRHALSHARALLELGDFDDAVDLLDDHLQNQRRNPEVAGQIASLLSDFALYDRAAEYAANLFLSGDASNIDQGFRLLADIHIQREDYGEFQRLADDYVERASNTTRARRTVTTLLADAGQWSVAIDHLQEFDRSPLHQFALEKGFHQYRNGDSEAAWNTFMEAAEESSEPASTFEEAGQFLEARGEFDAAYDAYRRAVEANPDDTAPRTARGSLAIRRGDLETARQDYAIARQSRTSFRGSQRLKFFDAFASTGHFDEARRVADDFGDDGVTPPGELRRRLGTWQLRSPQRDEQLRGYERISAQSWGQIQALPALDAAGHHDLVLELIEEEFADGDVTTAGILLLNRSTPLSRLVDWTHQRKLLDPVADPIQRGDGRLLGPIGDHRIRLGDLDGALLYLRAALDEGHDEYRLQYAHTHLLLGNTQQALEQFERSFLAAPPNRERLESMLLRFELAGQPDVASRFLDRLVAHPTHIDVALPAKTHFDLERHGDPHRAIDEIEQRIQSLRSLSNPGFYGDISRAESRRLTRSDILNRATRNSLHAVATAGFTDAVSAALERFEDLDDEERDELRLRIALAEGDSDGFDALATRLLESADSEIRRQQLRIHLARRAIGAGLDEPARQLVDRALDEQRDFRSHQPIILDLSLRIIADESLDGPIDRYLERVPNRRNARTTLSRELQRMGRDTEALRLLRRNIEFRPTTDTLRQGLSVALDDGDRDLAVDLTERIMRIADDPISEIDEAIGAQNRGLEPDLVLPIIERVRQARPRDLEWMLREARIRFIAGQVEPARTLIREALEAGQYHRDVVTEVVDMLYEERLFVEISRIVADEIPDDALWPRLVVQLAEADFALGFDDDALRWIRRLDEVTDRPDMWRIELADNLADNRHYDNIGPTLDTLNSEDGDVPFVDYLRGVARLAGGDGEQGLGDLRRANERGVNRLQTHHVGIRAALHGGRGDIASTFVGEMTQMPVRDDDFVSLPLELLLRSAADHPDGPAAVRQGLEASVPRIVDGFGTTWSRFIGHMASTFEDTGDPLGAYGFYRDRLWRSHFVDDSVPLPTYLNNLAYSYATTDTHIDEGLAKIRRAIVLSDERMPSFIDSLGWLLYRQGDLEGAEREIRRALRSYRGPASGLHELLGHLQTITYERGIYDTSADIATHLNRLPPRGIEW